MPKVMKATVLRNHLSDAIKEVEQKEDFLLIARNDEIISALVDIDFFESLLAKTSKQYLKSIQEARKNYEKGETFTHEEVFGRL